MDWSSSAVGSSSSDLSSLSNKSLSISSSSSSILDAYSDSTRIDFLSLILSFKVKPSFLSILLFEKPTLSSDSLINDSISFLFFGLLRSLYFLINFIFDSINFFELFEYC